MKNNPNMTMLITVVAILFLAAYGVKENSVLTSGPGGSGTAPIGGGYNRGLETTTPATVSTANKDLSKIPVEPSQPMKGYSREHFPHWRSVDNGCDGREAALKHFGENVRTGSGCKILSGKWSDPYTSKTSATPGDLDIDHVVPLAEAWRSGANEWSDKRRQEFANDYKLVLLPVDASANRAKGDKDPAAWKPPNKAYWRAYAQHWIEIKQHYGLTMDANEKKALEAMLAA